MKETCKESDSMSMLAIEKERWNEPKYRKLYTDLLKKHRGIVGGAQEETQCHNPEDFSAELAILKKTMTSEREAMLYGVAAGVVAFASMRYLPKYLIKRFGGQAKLKALREAEEQAKASNVVLLRNATGKFFFRLTI